MSTPLHHSLRLCILSSGLLLAGGCPTSTTGGGDGTGAATNLVGTWRGSLTCSRTQTVGSITTSPVTDTRSLELTFDENGRLTGVTVIGFSGSQDLLAAVSVKDDEVTLNSTIATLNAAVTQVVHVNSATYTADSAKLTLGITYTATGGNLTQDGTATQTIEVSDSGDSLSYSASVTYDVTQKAGDVTIQSAESTQCTGTLTRVP